MIKICILKITLFLPEYKRLKILLTIVLYAFIFEIGFNQTKTWIENNI